MSEKVAPVFLPPLYEQGAQQLIVKDAKIFIGREQPHRSTSLCSQCLMVVGVLIVFGIGVVILGPKLGSLNPTVIVVSQPAAPCGNPPIIDSTTAASTTLTTTSSMVGVFNTTIVYSMKNPAATLSSYIQIAILYTAEGYRTTISFALQNSVGNTYLDDVSVTTVYGQELVVNGNFENGTTGWTGVHLHDNYNYGHNGSSCHASHDTSQANVSQSFYTTPGALLNISFSLQWDKSGTGIDHQVTVVSTY